MSKVTKFLLSPWLALITFAILLSVKFADPFLVESMRLKFYDYLMLGDEIPSEVVVVANIDEEAIEKYGQYPFPREVYSEIISDLYGNGAYLVGLGIMFPESDRFGGDGALEQTLSEYPVVLSQTVTDNCASRTETQNIRRTGVAVIGDGQPTDFLPNYPCVLDNIPMLQEAAYGVGVTSTLPEADGVVRRVPLLATSDGEYYPAFALEVLRVLAGDPSYQAKINQTGVEALRIPQFDTIETDPYGRIFINPNYTFEQFNIGEPIPDLTGRVVVLGVTASGISNPLATSGGAQYPHVLQSTILETLLSGHSFSIPVWAPLLDYGLFAFLALALVLISSRKYSLVYIAVLIGAYFYLPVYMFNENNYLIDITFNAIAIILIYLHLYTVKFISEYLQKQQIKKQFGTYLSPALVEKLQKNPELLKLGGESRELSIMFTDVRGFTTISEHYGKDVQGLTQIMNRYMTAMTKKIIDNNGTLDKYIGDAQMAFWNAPLDDKNHAVNAVETGLEMLDDLEKFNEEIEREGVPAFGMGLGINTDTVVVGNMGSDQRFDYTCLGDGVNLASRLEGQTKPYGVKIIIGPKTAEQVQHVYQTVELDLVAVKGKTEPAKIYTVLRSYDTIGELQHEKFLTLYRQGNFSVAKRFAIELSKQSWNGELYNYYQMMIERIDQLKKNPPKEWDGVFRATSK